MKIKNIIIHLGLCLMLGMAQDNQLTPQEIEAGWALLYDGTEASLQDWTIWGRDNENNNQDITGAKWSSRNGFMTVDRTGSDIRTDRKYGDFVVTLDYQTDGNQGFMYRASLCGNSIWWSAIEVAIDNNSVDLSDRVTPGAAYGLYTPAKNNYKSNQINKLTIVAVKDSVEHWHNGEKLVGFKYWSDDFESQYNNYWVDRDRSPYTVCYARPYEPGEQPDQTTYIKEGYIGLQGNHQGYWQIKNFKILENPKIGCMKEGYENYDSSANFDYWGDVDCGDTLITDISPRENANKWYLVQSKKGHVMVKLWDIDNIVDLSIHDVVGNEVVAREKAAAGNHSFKLKSGIYFVRMKSVELEITQRVLVH